MRSIVLLLTAIILFGCSHQPLASPPLPAIPPPISSPHIVTLQTQDGVTIVGDYLDAGAGKPHALLLHMMPATRTSYRAFAEKLREIGYSSLAIDFRGHGESTKQGDRMLNYQRFSEIEHQEKIRDVEAAVEWLIANKGASRERLLLVGASIGANLALQYLAEHPDVPRAIILSAGLNYKGVTTEPFAKALKPTQSVLFAASDDDETSFESHRILFKITPAKKAIRELSGAGHGTTMFSPAFVSDLLIWLKT